MTAIANISQGFIHLVSVTGVTGTQSQIDAQVPDLILKIRNVMNKSISVDFSISGA